MSHRCWEEPGNEELLKPSFYPNHSTTYAAMLENISS